MADIPVKKTGFLAVGCTVLAGIAAAQTPSARFGLGGGATIPTGDYKTTDKVGWHALGVVQFGVPRSPVDIRVDGMYSRTSYDTTVTLASGSTKLYGGLVSLVYNVGPKALMARAYVLGGAGAYHAKFESGGSSVGETKFAFGGGGGVSFSLAAVHAFVEARWVSVRMSGGSLSFFPLSAGLMFGT